MVSAIIIWSYQGVQQLTGDGGLYLTNYQTNLVMALHALPLLFLHFLNVTAHHQLGKYKPSSPLQKSFVDVEGMKDVKRMITLLAITSQFIPTNRRGSERLRKLADRVRKQMLINTHKVN